jgi:hypothetical protein
LNARVLHLPDSRTGAKVVAIESAAIGVFKNIAKLATIPTSSLARSMARTSRICSVHGDAYVSEQG